MSEFDCHISIRRTSHAALRAVMSSLSPPAFERNTLDFAWRNDELDIAFEPASALGAEIDYHGSGVISSAQAAAFGYCGQLFESLLNAGIVCCVELYSDDELVLERKHHQFARAK